MVGIDGRGEDGLVPTVCSGTRFPLPWNAWSVCVGLKCSCKRTNAQLVVPGVSVSRPFDPFHVMLRLDSIEENGFRDSSAEFERTCSMKQRRWDETTQL